MEVIIPDDVLRWVVMTEFGQLPGHIQLAVILAIAWLGARVATAAVELIQRIKDLGK